MPIVEGSVEVRGQAQDLLLEFGTPLPGNLHTLEELGEMLAGLHAEELRYRRGAKVLRNLYLWLRNPSLVSDILQNNPNGADAGQLININLYNRVLEHARRLPLKAASAPFRKDTVTIRSSHPGVEEQLLEAAQAAVYSMKPRLPRIGISRCNIRVSLSGTNYWVMQPTGEVFHRRTPVTLAKDLNRVRTLVDAATAYHQPK